MCIRDRDFYDYLGNTFIPLFLTSFPRVLLPVEGLLPDEWIYFNDIDRKIVNLNSHDFYED